MWPRLSIITIIMGDFECPYIGRVMVGGDGGGGGGGGSGGGGGLG